MILLKGTRRFNPHLRIKSSPFKINTFLFAKKKEAVSEDYIQKVNGIKYKRYCESPKGVVSTKRNMLITAALPYVNNEPHLGNLIGAILSADVFARFCRLMDYNVLYICGTDEYGTATETKALLEKKTPQEVCDYYHAIHKEIYNHFDIDFDYFGRTSDSTHEQLVHEIFEDCYSSGFIKEKSMNQLFCKSCDRFLADRFVYGKCPKCHSENTYGDQCDSCQSTFEATELNEPKCFVCHNDTVCKDSTHLFLDLERMQERLMVWVEDKINNSSNNWTNNAIGITKSWFKKGLKPRCITRDLRWGIRVPLEKFAKKCFYVWFDAPIGYMSITAMYMKNWRDWWMNPDNVELTQFMGKDNVVFHTIFFPTSLLTSNKQWTTVNHLSVTEYLNYGEKKFSKSKGTGVFGSDLKDIDNITIDQWRYYLLSVRPEKSDSVFSWEEFAAKNNNDLKNNIGNFINRILGFLYKRNKGEVPMINLDLLDK